MVGIKKHHGRTKNVCARSIRASPKLKAPHIYMIAYFLASTFFIVLLGS